MTSATEDLWRQWLIDKSNAGKCDSFWGNKSVNIATLLSGQLVAWSSRSLGPSLGVKMKILYSSFHRSMLLLLHFGVIPYFPSSRDELGVVSVREWSLSVPCYGAPLGLAMRQVPAYVNNYPTDALRESCSMP
ncbi:hypothetical protein ONS96_009563 [Cadophora gregata f. sp. sojae]|nr:hypothetical protein ONS96_009563 [Cadophora gregata f. sp. sojae]